MEDPSQLKKTEIKSPEPSANKSAVYERRPFNIWKPFAFLLFIAIVVETTYILTLSLKKDVENPLPTSMPTLSPLTTADPLSTASAIPSVKLKLSQVLLQNCVEEKITLDKLPFTFNQALKDTYKIENSINCYPPKESYANIFVQTNAELGARNMYFFHESSSYDGQLNEFVSLNTFKTVSVNGQNYWINIMEPGPYGISTQGLWVKIINEKQDPETGTIVRASSFEVIKDQRVMDLIKKYGTAQGGKDNIFYTITTASKKIQFINAFIPLAGEIDIVKAMAGNVSTDLSGVSFN